MTTADTPTTEITIVVPEKDQLPPSLLSNIESGFKPAFELAEKWRVQALAIQITSADQKTEMKQARLLRLELKNTRVAADKTRKNLKADALLMGRAIDGVYNLLEAAPICSPSNRSNQYTRSLLKRKLPLGYNFEKPIQP